MKKDKGVFKIKPSVKDLKRLKAIVEFFDTCSVDIPACNTKDPIQCSELIERLQAELQIFGIEHGI